MESKSWIIRFLVLLLLFQMARGIINASYLVLYFFDIGIYQLSNLTPTILARMIEAICAGSLSVPVGYALMKSRSYTGNLLDWYLIIFVWCFSIRQIVEFVYHENSLLNIVMTFVINVIICRIIIRIFQRKHLTMYQLSD